MNRVDNSKFLLYIEPKAEQKSKEPINDEITEIVEQCLKRAVSGTANYSDLTGNEEFSKGSGWRGTHTTDCGMKSDNKDYLLENGMITNSLCVYYLQYYRDVIPESEMEKVNSLCSWVKSYYNNQNIKQ